jgi:hypothetical protein
MFDVNSTAQLLGAFGVLDRVKPVLLNLFFPMEQVFETEEVYFDRVQRARALAPFVVPTVAGKPMRSRGYTTGSFKPPYVKPKHAVEPIRAFKRLAGERLLGELSPEARFQMAIMDNMLVEDDEITRTEEWMAAQLLLSGKMTCVGPDFPAMLIDLGRNSANTVALTGSATWGSANIDPLQNMRSWASSVQAISGFHPGVVVLDPLASNLFINSPSVLRVMQSFRQTTGNIDLAGKVTGGGLGDEVKFLGSIAEFDIFQYQQLYTDPTGAVQQFMPNNSVIMGNPKGCQGIRTYGAIKDRKAGFKALARFPKVWDEEDPSATFTMMQSAPLPLLGWADATFAATVA